MNLRSALRAAALAGLLTGLAAGVAALLAAPPARAQTPGATVLVVANQTAVTASIVDAATNRTLAALPMAASPHEVAVTRDGRWALVTEYGDQGTVGHSVKVLDLATNTVARTIDLAPHTRPHDVEFLPGDTAFVVTSETSRMLLVVGFRSGRILKTLPTGRPGSHMLALTADGRRVFSGNIPTGDATAFDLTTGAATDTIPLVAASEGIAVSPDGRHLWAGSRSKDSVVVVDVASGRRLAAFAAPGTPYRVTMAADGRRAVVSTPEAGVIRVYDAVALRELGTVATPGGPVGGAITPDGRTMYVALHETGRVAVVDLDGLRVAGHLDVGAGPDGVGVAVRR